MPYGLVDPDVLLSTFPGPPRRVKSDAPFTSSYEAQGYHAAGDLLVATVVIPKRTSVPLNDYDTALSVVLMVAPSITRGAEIYTSQSRQDQTFSNRMAATPISLTPPLEAVEGSAWSVSGPASQVVVLARYKNYVIRFVGGIAADGLFSTQADFLAAVRKADRHVMHTLTGAA